jgi:hypothetical protein
VEAVMRVMPIIACMLALGARGAGANPFEREQLAAEDLEVELAAEPAERAPPAPEVAEVIVAAYAAAGLDRDPSPSWIRRARIAGLVPWVSVRTGWDVNWQDPATDIDRGRTIEVRATWRLDRLMFDGRELQVASIDAARRRERRRLAAHVIRTYFAWRRAAALALRNPRWVARAEEGAAELDALTDGWFSDELARPRRTASENRTPGLPRP